MLKEQVIAMGGDKSDLELLSGVKEDEQMELGDEAADVSAYRNDPRWTHLRFTYSVTPA